MSTIKRTSRESTSKVSKEAKKTWAPPSSLDAPPAPNGYAHRWIRTTVQGFEDTANVSKKMREGWEFVKVEQGKTRSAQTSILTIPEGNTRGVLELGALCWQGYQMRFWKAVRSILKDSRKTE